MNKKLKENSYLSGIKAFFDSELKNNFIYDDLKKINWNYAKIDSEKLLNSYIKFYCIEEISFDSNQPRSEAFENIVTALKNPGNFNFIYFISGDSVSVKIYLGIGINYNNPHKYLNSADYGSILESSINGNFQGSKFTKNSKDKYNNYLSIDQVKEQIFNPILKSEECNILTGIPSASDNINEHISSKDSIIDFQGIDKLINSMSDTTWQYLLICESVDNTKISLEREKIYELYNNISPFQKETIQISNNNSQSKITSDVHTEQSGTSNSKNNTKALNKNKDETEQEQWGESDGTSDQHTVTENNGGSHGETSSREYYDKRIEDLLEYLKDELIPRYSLGINRGLFKTSSYIFAENLANMEKLKNNMISIFQGDKNRFNPIRAHSLDNMTQKESVVFKKYILNFQSLNITYNTTDWILPSIKSNPVDMKNKTVTLGTYLTSREIALISGFPTKEVIGVPLKKGVDFGLNLPILNNGINIGYLLQRGREVKEKKVFLDNNHLNKHIFIGGVTGSGKTNTCQKLLLESNLPFLVIEPAKTEYRNLLNCFKKHDIEVFTIGSNTKPFRFNPFELLEKESITSHIDMLKSTFIAAFPMEAAMPYLIEEALYRTYETYGWDVVSNKNNECIDPWNENGLYWPTFSDFLIIIEKIITEKKFGPELEANYKGALISRFKNFTIGSKGEMLNCRVSVDLNELMSKKVILELECLKDPREKAMMMGFILSRIGEIVKSKHVLNKEYKHITLIEEAHRLLAKHDYGDGGSKKSGIQVFTDMLAEIRKYGESFIIVDQIPNKLTSEVLKNTGTKIIHRLFAEDDKNAVGSTMSLNDEQKQYLSYLGTGETIMFTQDWSKPINTQINKVEISSVDISDAELHKQHNLTLYKNLRTYYPTLYKYEQLNLQLDLQRIHVLKKYIETTDKIILYLTSNLLLYNKEFEKLHIDIKRLFDIDEIDEKILLQIVSEKLFFRTVNYFRNSNSSLKKDLDQTKNNLIKLIESIISNSKIDFTQEDKREYKHYLDKIGG